MASDDGEMTSSGIHCGTSPAPGTRDNVAGVRSTATLTVTGVFVNSLFGFVSVTRWATNCASDPNLPASASRTTLLQESAKSKYIVRSSSDATVPRLTIRSASPRYSLIPTPRARAAISVAVCCQVWIKSRRPAVSCGARSGSFFAATSITRDRADIPAKSNNTD